MNVMARIKKSKKPRVVDESITLKAAQFMKQQKQAVGKQLQDVEYLKTQDPLREILKYPESFWYELLSDYVQRLPELSKNKIQIPSKEFEQIKAFNFLLYNVPFSQTKKFIRRVVSTEKSSQRNNLNPFLNEFNMFIQTPENVNKVNSMKSFLKSREATPQKYTQSLKRPVVPQPLGRRLQPVVPQPLGQPQKLPIFGKGEILSQCEREYGNASWMRAFTNEPIRGILIKTNTRNKYTSSPYINGWYKVNMSWIKDACENNPETRNYPIAYLTNRGKIIPETPFMYQSSMKKQLEIRVQDKPTNALTFDTAKAMLKNSIIPPDDVNGVLSSLDLYPLSSTNRDVAKRLSQVLVYLDVLISEPQVHHYRVKSQQYSPDILVTLDRNTLLPEVYENPNITKTQLEDFETVLNRKRNIIEQQFYTLYETLQDPQKRKRNIQPILNFKPLKTNVYKNCPPGVSDVMFYQDENYLFCLDRQAIINKIYNPVTGKPFSQEFLTKVRQLQEPNSRFESVSVQRQASERELAPGLIQKLKDEIRLLETYTCSNCNEQIMFPLYKSVRDQQKVLFCGEDCFENYKF